MAGCSTNRETAYVPPERSGPATLPDGSGGVYKTGNPYKVGGRWYTPMRQAKGYDQHGIASWYGRDFHGKRTANGEIYDMHALSAAHTTLPMPTLVRVTNLENGRSVVVRVNDRGPFVKDRLIDLSYAAAKELGYDRKGTVRVRVQTLDVPADEPQVVAVSAPARAEEPRAIGGVYVQLGAFGSRENAERLRRELVAQYPSIQLSPIRVVDTTLYRVRIGPFSQMRHIEQTIFSLQKSGYQQAIVIIE